MIAKNASKKMAYLFFQNMFKMFHTCNGALCQLPIPDTRNEPLLPYRDRFNGASHACLAALYQLATPSTMLTVKVRQAVRGARRATLRKHGGGTA